jgi:hypothetical protein
MYAWCCTFSVRVLCLRWIAILVTRLLNCVDVVEGVEPGRYTMAVLQPSRAGRDIG